jgi:hypothetical protein
MKNLSIKNSTIQFLAFVSEEQGGNTVDIAFQNGDLWATEKVMSLLYGIDRSGISRHIKNIIEDGELEEKMVCAFFAHTTQHGAIEGKTQTQEIKYYDAFSPLTKKIFATAMNKLHWAVHHNTAAEVIYYRSDAEKTNMGLTTWENAPEGKIVKTDVSIAKNYLTKDELESLGRIVNAYLDLAEDRAKKGIPMTMQNWANRLDKFLLADDRDLLQNAGKISAQIAKDKAESEFEKYRVKQDQLYQSDFDRFIQLEEQANGLANE